MGSLPLNDILNRLDELRNVFVLGQRAMPFIEEVLAFLREIVPILDEVDSSIRVSTSKMMPTATSRIASVNQATELATTEIMDLVDETNDKVSSAQEKIERSRKHLRELDDVDQRLLSLLREKINDQALQTQIEDLFREKEARRTEVIETQEQNAGTLGEIRTHMNAIMMALQVQDITSQQLASVSHLIETVRVRLSRFEGRLGSGTLEDFLDTSPPTNVTFDGNASFDRTGKKQEDADAVIASFTSKNPVAATDSATTASTEEIDALFGTSSATEKNDSGSVETSQDEIDALFGTSSATEKNDSGSVETSQDEIDALFGNGSTPANAPNSDGSGSVETSQDEIDALFGNTQPISSAPASQDEVDALFAGDGAPSDSPTQDQIDSMFNPVKESASQDEIDNLFNGKS